MCWRRTDLSEHTQEVSRYCWQLEAQEREIAEGNLLVIFEVSMLGGNPALVPSSSLSFFREWRLDESC
jgi:hypothetical protein